MALEDRTRSSGGSIAMIIALALHHAIDVVGAPIGHRLVFALTRWLPRRDRSTAPHRAFAAISRAKLSWIATCSRIKDPFEPWVAIADLGVRWIAETPEGIALTTPTPDDVAPRKREALSAIESNASSHATLEASAIAEECWQIDSGRTGTYVTVR